jgi:antitoxin HigA-1
VPIVAIPRASLGVIEKAFGVKMDTLMRMQSAFDIAQTRRREKEIHVRRIRRAADVHP